VSAAATSASVFPGIRPGRRASEAFQPRIIPFHIDGADRGLMARREGIGAATVQRYFRAGPARLVTLGETLHASPAEIAAMWRCTRNNGITEGLHTEMEVMHRQAYGFRNFRRDRLRVRILCR